MRERVLAWKANTDPAARLAIAVLDADGARVGTLALIDRALAAEAGVAARLTSWRRMFMHAFLTQFPATEARTQAWLDGVVLPADDRLLFMMLTADGDAVGHIGLCKMTAQSGEIDNLIRGKRGGDPRLVHYCELALLAWMFGALGQRGASLHVFSNNEATIALHENVGFDARRSYALRRRSGPDATEYLLDGSDGEAVAHSYVEYGIARAALLARHPWLARVYPWTA